MPKPSGHRIDYPVCGDWSCEDYDYDWEPIGPDDPAYSDVKREYEIVYYHQPRTDWPRRLQAERDKRNGGEPLWVGAEDRAREAQRAAEKRHAEWLWSQQHRV